MPEQARAAVLGVSLMVLALQLDNPDKSGHGYASSTQARPAFMVLAVVSAAAVMISLTRRAQSRGQAGRSREAEPSVADH